MEAIDKKLEKEHDELKERLKMEQETAESERNTVIAQRDTLTL